MSENKRDGVIIYPRNGEKAEDLLAVMKLIGFDAEAFTSHGV